MSERLTELEKETFWVIGRHLRDEYGVTAPNKQVDRDWAVPLAGWLERKLGTPVAVAAVKQRWYQANKGWRGRTRYDRDMAISQLSYIDEGG